MYFLNPNLIKNDGYLSFSHQYLDEIKESNNYVNLKDHFGATPKSEMDVSDVSSSRDVGMLWISAYSIH